MSAQYKIQEILYPLFVDDPSVFLYTTALHNPITSSRMNGLNGYNRTQQYGSFSSSSVTSAGPGAASNSSSSANPTSPTNWDRHNSENTSSSKSFFLTRVRLNSIYVFVRACVFFIIIISCFY